MDEKAPVIRRIAWSYTVPHLLVMSGLILLIWRVQASDRFEQAVFYGAFAYLVYSFGSKAILLRRHRRGIRFTRLNLFREAVSEFQGSYSFLSKYPWVDKYRCLTMLDSSAIQYREMALCNIAFAYVQLNEQQLARKYYQMALEQFPDSDLAQGGLEHVESKETG